MMVDIMMMKTIRRTSQGNGDRFKFCSTDVFTASGKLLRLEERSSPVLIIKILKNGVEEWIALGELNQGEFDDDEDEDSQDEDTKNL